VASEAIFTEFVVTRVLYTARISNVESTVCDNEERLTAVQSPRTTPVKNLTKQSGTGKLSGTTCPRWIGHELVYFGIVYILIGTSHVSRTLANVCGCKPVAFKFLFQKKLFFNPLPNLKLPISIKKV